MTSGSTPAPRPDPDALRWRFGTSGGPGGQHANRTETRVEVTFDVDAAKCLTETQRHLLLQRLGTSVVVTCDETRSQWRNRAIARAPLRTHRIGARGGTPAWPPAGQGREEASHGREAPPRRAEEL
ncbi:MAG: peptide chain release factor-like protein [Acidimicrobiia bacterium]